MWRWVSIFLLPLVDLVVCLLWHKFAGELLDVGLFKSGLCHPIPPLSVVPNKQTTSTVPSGFVPLMMEGDLEMAREGWGSKCGRETVRCVSLT